MVHRLLLWPDTDISSVRHAWIPFNERTYADRLQASGQPLSHVGHIIGEPQRTIEILWRHVTSSRRQKKRHQSAMNCARRYSLFNDIPRLFPSRRRGNRNVDNDRSQHITHCCRGRLYSNVTLTMQSSVYYPLVFLRIVLNSWNTGTNLRELDLLLDLFDLLLSCATL